MTELNDKIKRQEIIDQMYYPINFYNDLYKVNKKSWIEKASEHLVWLHEIISEGEYIPQDRNEGELFEEQQNLYDSCHKIWGMDGRPDTEKAYSSYCKFMDLLKFDVNKHNNVVGFNPVEIETIKKLITFLNFNYNRALGKYSPEEAIKIIKHLASINAFEGSEEEKALLDVPKQVLKAIFKSKKLNDEQIEAILKLIDSREKADKFINWAESKSSIGWSEAYDEAVEMSSGGVSM